MRCPACSGEMASETLEANYGRSVAIDLCSVCAGLWFDERESLALTPGATLHLFKLMHEHAAARNPKPLTAASCPRCARSLVATSDRQRNTRFNYWRCASGHGRFIAFAEFLREKNFVRPLDARELAELRAHVKMVHCSSCGAGVDLEASSACTYCRAPVSMLDPHQVETVVRGLQEAEIKRQTVDPALPARIAMDRLQVERLWQELDIKYGRQSLEVQMPRLLDAGLAIVADLLGKRG